MVVRLSRMDPPVECIRLWDRDTGLDGVIAIHSTALGPGAGGCRFWSYPDIDHVMEDAFLLAENMSYKNALAGLPFGGAKAVLRRPEGAFDREALFRAFGRVVEGLGGQYVTADDIGTTASDMQEVASVSRHVAGLKKKDGLAGGEPAPWTARGVFDSIRAAARVALGAELRGLRVAVQGTGNVGAQLCALLATAGAKLVIADPLPGRRDRLHHILDAEVVDVEKIHDVEADIFAPCALGGALTPASVKRLKAFVVCGGANSQLESPEVADMLLDRGITYVPDYVASAGGIISVSAEYLGESDRRVAERVAEIGPRVAAIIERAAREGRSPAATADEMAEDVIANAERAPA